MSTAGFRFTPAVLPPETVALREEVRQFIAEELASGAFVPGPGGFTRFDSALSRKIGERGWIGMTWPKKYGGHERSMWESYVAYEELEAAGFPIRTFHPADRQVGPLILQFGTEELKLKYLPRIAAGELTCAIGLSEPDSGSDLAAIRTAATKVEGGWRVNGRKVWTSYAHKAQLLNMLLRTSPKEQDRHAGVSRFLLDLSSPGVSIRPIVNMTGRHEFNEVVFDDVFVPDEMVLGKVGDGWRLLGNEMAYERSGPDRWLVSFDTLKQLIDLITPDKEKCECAVTGRLVAHLWTLRQMSLSVTGMLERGELPSVEAAVVKDLGTTFDQEVPHAARSLVTEEARAIAPDSQFNAFLRYDLLFAPSLSLKGGTREILRNAIARELGLR